MVTAIATFVGIVNRGQSDSDCVSVNEGNCDGNNLSGHDNDIDIDRVSDTVSYSDSDRNLDDDLDHDRDNDYIYSDGGSSKGTDNKSQSDNDSA